MPRIALVPQALHQHDLLAGDLISGTQPVLRILARETRSPAMANHHIESVFGVFARNAGSVSGPMTFICSMIDPEPSMRDNHRQSVRCTSERDSDFRLDVGTINRRDELRQGVQARFPRTSFPIVIQLAQ